MTPQHEKQIGYWVSEKDKCMSQTGATWLPVEEIQFKGGILAKGRIFQWKNHLEMWEVMYLVHYMCEKKYQYTQDRKKQG